MAKKTEEGITIEKEKDIAEWYTQVCLKSELADYGVTKGTMIIRPNGYAIWQAIQDYFDENIIKNLNISFSGCYLYSITSMMVEKYKTMRIEEGKKPEDIGVVIQESKAEPENKEKAESKEDEAEAPGGQESAPAEEPEYEAGSDVVVEEESIGSQSPNSE